MSEFAAFVTPVNEKDALDYWNPTVYRSPVFVCVMKVKGPM